MPIGVLLAVLAFSIYSVGDSIVKSFGSGTLSVFEINFFLNLFALSSLPLARRPEDRWSDIFRLRRPWLMNGRALLYTAATLCFTVAITRIPFAETRGYVRAIQRNQEIYRSLYDWAGPQS